MRWMEPVHSHPQRFTAIPKGPLLTYTRVVFDGVFAISTLHEVFS